ncbi:hypothetical protein BA190_13165 [Labrys sp. WJW]|uniref:hypothetical protein n=1 Tax=Labrys sp. WJW TaxID=1737983 RepID=UPI00082C2C5A|nr:hypothetical protein [Labrys sp. WJW]OCC04637.1 hypothetical protein BA190_13165 [Labrys sp. WJW]
MAWILIRLFLTAVVLAAPLAAQAGESCRSQIQRGATVIDSYVMDFGPRDKLYVYILRLPDGQTAKCTTRKAL